MPRRDLDDAAYATRSDAYRHGLEQLFARHDTVLRGLQR